MVAEDSTSLTVPTWVPEPVAQAARALHDHHLKANNVKSCALQRLVADERMRRVWGELSKRRRERYQKTDVFQYCANLPWVDTDAPQDHQDAAMASLLYFAVNHAGNAPRVITRKELETVRGKEHDKVAALGVAADEIRLYGPSQAAAVKVIEDHARNLEEQLSKMEASPLVVERDTGDAQARCFCILFAGRCRQLFGSPLYGITAIVASVALGREITDRAAREWCNSHPADKSR
jgi:hypothetical protein